MASRLRPGSQKSSCAAAILSKSFKPARPWTNFTAAMISPRAAWFTAGFSKDSCSASKPASSLR
eukprot:6819068-Alexandrium_andersonii.AAC.1